MQIPVLVEPHADGFRASTGSPVPLSADGPSEDAAVAALRALLADRLRAGGRLRTLTLTGPTPVLPPGPGLADNPLFDDWLAAVEEYRTRRDAEEQAAEAAGHRPRAADGWPSIVLDTRTLSLHQRNHAQVLRAVAAHTRRTHWPSPSSRSRSRSAVGRGRRPVGPHVPRARVRRPGSWPSWSSTWNRVRTSPR